MVPSDFLLKLVLEIKQGAELKLSSNFRRSFKVKRLLSTLQSTVLTLCPFCFKIKSCADMYEKCGIIRIKGSYFPLDH
jgi:hypothetical protein